MEDRIESPCINVCTLDQTSGFCLGCYRTIEEISHWMSYSAGQQRALMQQLEQRKMALVARATTE